VLGSAAPAVGLAAASAAELVASADLSALASADLLVLVVVGLLAGAHCLGMCGPVVLLYADRLSGRNEVDSPGATDSIGTTDSTGTTGSSRRADGGAVAAGSHTRTGAPGHVTVYQVRQHLLFNLGRTASYATIGALLGLLGGVVFVGAERIGPAGQWVRALAGIVAGLVIVAAGVGYLLGRPGTLHAVEVPLVGSLATRLAGRASGAVDRLVATPGIALLGAAHGLLPCPIIYPAYLYAFVLGDPLAGGLALAALGLGTIPSLLALGLAIGSIGPERRQTLHRALGAAMVALGYVPLAHGLMLAGIHLPHPPLPYPEIPLALLPVT